jgi:hypothetical protein
MRAPRIPPRIPPDLRLSIGCSLVVRFLLHFIPDGMQLIARFRTSSIHFRTTQVRQLTLLETS